MPSWLSGNFPMRSWVTTKDPLHGSTVLSNGSAGLEPEQADRLGQMLGCFLGECICRNFGGQWQESEYGPAVVFADGNSCFPLNKTGKHFANGADDSVLSFYQTIPILFGNSELFGDEQNAS